MLGGPTASGAAVACARSSATASGAQNRLRGCDEVVPKCSYNAVGVTYEDHVDHFVPILN